MLLNEFIVGLITLLLMAAFVLGALYLYAPFKIRYQQVKEMNAD